MSRVVLTLTGLLLLVMVGCSDKQKEIKPKKEHLESNLTKKEESTVTKVEVKDKIEVKEEIESDIIEVEIIGDDSETNDGENQTNMMVVPEEFIPEHIRRSHIEVVPH